MKEETDGIYKNASIKPVFIGFLVMILIALICGLIYFSMGRPVMHTQPQPANNKGSLVLSLDARQC